jgi:uncharacterized lipoprotein YmbA
MKQSTYLCLLLLTLSLAFLGGGCVIKPASVPTRHFVLAPIPAPEHIPTAGEPLAVEISFVKMPSYLLRDSMVVRKSAHEVEYLETALWAERLDQSFRHTLAENLSLLLAVDGAALPVSERDRARVSVDVEQFDVHTDGQGTLLAEWRLTTGSNKPIKSGHVRLLRPGPSPRGNPQAIATTLSALVGEFSRELAQALLESAQARN